MGGWEGSGCWAGELSLSLGLYKFFISISVVEITDVKFFATVVAIIIRIEVRHVRTI